jgi:phosphate uptake regulator
MTLPSHWVKKLNIVAGDEMDLQERENALIINGPQHTKEKRAEIDLRGLTIPILWRYFQSAYRAGCDEIKVVYDPNKMYEDAFNYYTTQFPYLKLGEKIPLKPAIAVVLEVVNRFIGIEVIESGEGYCIIKEMGEASKKEFEHSLRRIFLVLLQLFDRVIEVMEKGEHKGLTLCKELHAIDTHVDKFVDYCVRILNKIADSYPENKKYLMFSSLFILELVGDEFKYIGKHLAFAKKIDKEVPVLARLVKSHFELYHNLFFKFERETTTMLGTNDSLLYQTHFKMRKKMHGDDRSLMRHFMTISKFVLALVELRIEMEF